MVSLSRTYTKLVSGLIRVAAFFAFLCILAAIAVTLCDILLRTISRIFAAFNGTGLTWAVPGLVDLTQLFVMAAASMAIAVAFHRQAHVAIDLVDNLLPASVRSFNVVLSMVIATVFLAAGVRYGLLEMQGQLELNTSSSTLNISYVWYWIPLLAGFALSFLAVIDGALRHMVATRPAGASQAEHHDV
ncbi:TRAP transporter small permease subunit [Labrenzia sp. 011]|uniref:TRAP transporter small permease n=1 Tax=Labrenzia sp. 011 TaxID=2171494 RepID=UPI000D51F2C0|nr:TRAP transporter small permease subunit [Labrenzia sp. 011]PVB62417.1 hypothetical protein DCO57_06575 [Labrenzia sp. 011]